MEISLTVLTVCANIYKHLIMGCNFLHEKNIQFAFINTGDGTIMAAKKGNRVKVVLACTECKQRNYDNFKNSKNTTERLELNKYCRFCKKHTVHKESK